MSAKYSLEFILHAKDSSLKVIKNSLAEFGSDLVISEDSEREESHNYKVSMATEDPTLVFDLCSQLGRIRSVKIH
ncbi:MAG: hypothetical protein PHO40_06375 [Candidatus Omnitrophica bacterium]|jgi:dihydroxyacetone kinase-like predicted kinase|nr:hypothetical protein [Candidatus Omnitrophota bacterium]